MSEMEPTDVPFWEQMERLRKFEHSWRGRFWRWFQLPYRHARYLWRFRKQPGGR